MENRYLCKARPIGTRKQWVTGFYAVLGEKTVIIVNEPEKFYDVDSEKNSHGNKIVEVIPKTVCQCTGIKDKNGKLIWENDIVRVKYTDEQEYYQEIIEVTYSKHGFAPYSWEYECDGCDLRCEILEIEVIGDKFDNPELLENGEE